MPQASCHVLSRAVTCCHMLSRPDRDTVGLYREKESRYPLSLQQGEVAKVNAGSNGERLHKQVSFDGRSVYTNNRSSSLRSSLITQTLLLSSTSNTDLQCPQPRSRPI
jgi:hypothetical protein